MKGRRGITLAEALVACTVFLGMLGVAVMVFDYGVRGCLQAGGRADLQTQATRVLTSLQSDLRRSSDDSVVVEPRTITVAGHSLRRDGVSFLGRADWAAPGTYDSVTGAPRYDRYLNYYATTALSGKLVRAVLQGPDPPGPGAALLGNYSLALYGNDDPSLNSAGQLGFSVLSEQVRGFAVSQIDARRVQARLQLTAATGPGPTGGRSGEQSFEMVLEIRPANTVGF